MQENAIKRMFKTLLLRRIELVAATPVAPETASAANLQAIVTKLLID